MHDHYKLSCLLVMVGLFWSWCLLCNSVLIVRVCSHCCCVKKAGSGEVDPIPGNVFGASLVSYQLTNTVFAL